MTGPWSRGSVHPPSSPAAARRPLLGACLVAALSTGCGGFSSGDNPGLQAPPPPDFAKPENQGKVKGQVRIAEGFMPELAAQLELGGTASEVYEALEVRLEGTRRKLTVEVGGEGEFEAEELPPGLYRCVVSVQATPLAAFDVPVKAREDTGVRVVVEGRDLADLDGDGSRQDLAVRLEVALGPSGGRTVRVLLPDGSVRARLANGGTDYLLPGGVVRREQPGRGAAFRRDHDLDGILDPDDQDLRRRKEEAGEVSERDLLIGRAFPPLLRRAWVSDPHSERPPVDLALFRAEVGASFGDAPLGVRVRLYGAEGETHGFDLADDGSVPDLLPDWPGHQPSGDEVAGDGVWSHLVPIDATTRALIYNRQVVIEAVDAEGRRSNRYSIHLYRSQAEDPEAEAGSSPGEAPWNLVREVQFRGRRGGDGPEVSARFQAAPELDGVIATLVGPGGFKRVFAPAGDAAGDGWTTYQTPTTRLGDEGAYYVVLGVPGGSVFFAGRVLDPTLDFSARTGG